MSTKKILIASPDPQWTLDFAREMETIRAILGERALRIEHVGSTSVSGLAAKPVIDILLVVEDSSDEASYGPMLEAAGYPLRIREPEWLEHRMFNGPRVAINLHVLSRGCPEIDRMVRFRDWLRTHPEDRELYADTKIALAQKEWPAVQDYADAKSAVVEEILGRAR